MGRKVLLDRLAIYFPQAKMRKKPVERMIRLSEERSRSVNYLAVNAILRYLDKEEKKE